MRNVNCPPSLEDQVIAQFYWDGDIPWYKSGDGRLLTPTSEQFVSLIQAANSRIREANGRELSKPSEECSRGNRTPQESPIRDLMAALEYLRFACEHAEGKNEKERKMLRRAMNVGIRVGAKHKDILEDFQMDTYWEDVWAIPAKVGLPNGQSVADADEH